ncbi:MerR family transcriptional regulator [Streptosporangium sp. 'caverna']|uniref:helix-turn-helix domain-containing protein n=1 Tax=Streptosporangium sp. 'caverna' TaxID=2202249 RepID=UPI000D7D9EF3|nr:MerR family transcriptional regulator [Streptosporangium sp. 'caverna']AWS47707.1 MerR family transcriptional regulator [Streptosporangium sp. 'caverna']
MDDEPVLLTIGRLATRTGLPVRTIRYWSDVGALPPAGRSDGGYRLYDAESVARLELVATLRELGLSLQDVRRVLAKEITVADVATAHVEAIDVQIRTLRLRRAVLSTVAKRRTPTEEMTLMNRLARLSAQERRQIIDDFLSEVIGDVDNARGMRAQLRDTAPNLPDDPTSEQVDAWIELAELVQDPGFRQGVRLLADYTVRLGTNESGAPRDGGLNRRLIRYAAVAIEREVAPESAEAAEILEQILEEGPDAGHWADLLRDQGIFSDPRALRYWELLGVINGWPPYPEGVTSLEHLTAGMRVHDWIIAALRAHGRSPGTSPE